MIFLVTSKGAEQPHLILLQVKLDYIANILPQTGCPANSRLGSREAQSGQSRLFLPLFRFFDHTFRIIYFRSQLLST